MELPRNQLLVLTFLVVFRLINTSLIRTFFQPDEYFQSLEPAWQKAFGPDSGAYTTWEWKHQLRSSLHPWLFAGVYKAADYASSLLSLDVETRSTLLIAAPKWAQAGFAALGDWFTWKLAAKIYGADSTATLATLWMTILNPWQWYSSVRTFSNSLEMTLTVAALCFWPWGLLKKPKFVKENPNGSPILRTSAGLQSLRLSLFLAAVAVLLRPTNLLIWTPILLLTIRPSFIFGHELQELMLKYRMGKKIYDSDQLHALLELRDLRTPEILILAREVILCGSMALGFSVGADRIYFGDWAFPPYKWLYFNISQSLAVFYGRNPWHYYLFQGVPLLCTTLVPFLLMSFFTKQAIELRILRWAVYFTVVTLSLISHKEVRFIYPLLPLLHLIAAQPVANFFLSPAPPSQAKPASKSSLNLKNHTYLFAGLFINILLASYLGAFHQGAPLSVLTFLRTRYATTNQNDDRLFALFLMPCHSTPWRSHLVYPHLTARALTCEPPLHTLPGTTERETYRDEADRFYDDPLGFLGREVWPLDDASTQQTVPRYVVGFEGIHPWLEEFFASTAAKETLGDVTLDKVWEGWNGFFNEDWRRGGRMVVWEASVSSS